MTGPLYHLGRVCVRHHRIVLVLWLVVFVALAVLARNAGSETSDNLTLPGTGSQNATDLLQKRFPAQANGSNPVALQVSKGKLTDDNYSKAIDDTVDAFKNDSIVSSVTSPLSSDGKAQLSKDQTIGYIALTLKDSAGDLTVDEANRIIDEAGPAREAGIKTAFGGYLGQKVSKPETHSSEVIGLAAAVIVLLFTFGTVVAMGLPIITAIFGLVTGLSIVALVSHVADVPTVAPTVATMIGLGVGIDYALFVVTRHREQVRDGQSYDESIARAVATSGGAVVFAGSTVMIALLSLAVVGIPLVTALGYTSAIVVAVAVTGAVTLLPALLAVLGPRIESLKLPLPQHVHDATPHGWARWARFVGRRPWTAAIVALVVLGALAYPTLDLTLGQNDVSAQPTDTTVRQSYDIITKGFGAGTNGPLLISVDLSAKPAQPDQSQIDDINKQEQQQEDQAKETATSQQQLDQELDQIQSQADDQRKQAENPATDPRLQTLRTDMQKAPDVQSVSQPLVNDNGTAAVYNVISKSAPSDQSTVDLVNDLRDSVIPKATQGQSMTAYVGGTTAGYIDLASEISERLVRTIAIVIGLSFLLLMAAFRSLVIPLTAGLMNLISIGAAFGVVTAVFQKGWGVELVGLDHSVPIVSYVPLMMFAILFGLSMDYQVFLLTHIREHWQETRDNHEAVVRGLATTGRVITSAALIMVSVFCAFILNGDPTVKQFGVGMAVAVAVDATFVRCLLVPAVMTLLGRSNWWMPHLLDRALPDFSIEGEEYFAERDAAAGAAPASASGGS
jgi:RND superfamily putative drug exporter